MLKTITVYKDHTDNILFTTTGDREHIEKASKTVPDRFKEYPKFRVEITDAEGVEFQEVSHVFKPRIPKITMLQAFVIVNTIATLALISFLIARG